MKRIIILFVAIALWCNALAQNITAVEYFFDADPGYGSGTSVTITPASSITNFNFNVSISSVSDGFHTLTVRAKDANNKWSHAFTRPFYKLPASAVAAAPNITKLEYFFDADPGYGAGTNVTITAATSINNLSVTASLAAVSDGFHTITFRAQDASGRWGAAFTRPFYKLPAAAVAAAPNITKLEYFFDADPGYGAGTNVTITPGTSIVDLNVTASLSSVSDGFHTISFRTQDASGKWSAAFTRPFYKLPASAVAAAPNITKLEYFFDADPGYGAGTNVTITPGASIVALNVSADLSSVVDGFHTITFRTKDANNNWGPAFTRPFYKLPAAAIAAAPNITKLEYFIDTDPGYGQGTDVVITPAVTIPSLPIDISVTSLSSGTHTINLRAKDASGNWSIVHTANFGVFGPPPAAQPTILTFTSITTSSFTVAYTAPATAPVGYIAIRKAGSAPTKNPDDGITYTKGNALGDGTVAYVGTATTFNETALSSGTQYFYKIYAYNGSTTLTNYLTTTPLQGNTTTLADPVLITQQGLPSTFDKGGTLTVSVTVNSAAKASGVVLKYKGISEPALKSVIVTNSGNKFEKVIAASDLTDLIGIKYYFEVTDKSSGKVITSDTSKAYVRYHASSSDQKIPSLSFGAKESNYQIIAVPLLLSNDDVSFVFSALGDYDNRQWRLYDYGLKDNARDNREYTDGYFSRIEPGKGYWLIIRNSTTINPGEGIAAGSDLLVDENTPFPITLTPGWNLIGNPYNFTISWEDVLKASGKPSGVATALTIFKNGTLTADGSVLGPYRGAFIKNENLTDIELKVPVLRDTTLPPSGRISSERIDLLKNQWTIPISVSNGDLTNETGGIGMHPKAQLNDKDDFDRTSVPLVEGMNMPELIFSSSTSKIDITREVVPSQDRFTWKFDVRKTGEEILKLQWPVIEQKGDKKLVLLDLATQRLIDMTKENEIMLSSESKSLRLIFGDQNYINQVLEKELPAIGLPYPNPAHAEVKIPIFISESLDNSNVVVRVYNSIGKEVTTLVDDHFRKGYHLLNWKPTEPAGLYVVTMKVGSGEERRVKLIIQ